MKKLFLGLLVLSALGLALNEASASWNICGQKSCSYSFTSPRLWFGFDCCPPSCPGPVARPGAPAAAVPVAPAAPWFNQYPPPVPHAQAPAAAPALTPVPVAAPTTLPASYQMGGNGSGYANNYGTSYQVPSYWYGR